MFALVNTCALPFGLASECDDFNGEKNFNNEDIYCTPETNLDVQGKYKFLIKNSYAQ